MWTAASLRAHVPARDKLFEQESENDSIQPQDRSSEREEEEIIKDVDAQNNNIIGTKWRTQEIRRNFVC